MLACGTLGIFTSQLKKTLGEKGKGDWSAGMIITKKKKRRGGGEGGGGGARLKE